MNTNQYTQKTLEALQAAQQLAVEYQHNALEPEHLLHALASQEQGLIPQLLQKLNVDPGSFAAAAAAEAGAKTILIEKFGHDMASGIRDTLAACGSKQQQEDGDDVNKKDAVRYLCNWSQGYTRRSLAQVWADRSGETIDWFTDVLAESGIDFRHEIDEKHDNDNYEVLDVGHSTQYGDEYSEQLTMDAVLKHAEADGLEVQYEITMVKLEKDGDRVTGLIAKNANDEYVRYNASKGVILATGDYMNNEAMVKRWCPDVDGFDKKQYQKTGDGHIMAIDAGAKMENLGHTKMMHDFDSGLMYEEPFLYVNMEGKRFCNEDTGFVYMGNITKYVPKFNGNNVDANHPDGSLGWYCQIYDNDYMSYANSPIPEQVMTKYIPGAVENPQGVFTNLIDTYKADTIEELAGLLGVPADELQKTIDRYNELCDKGADVDFGKKSAYMHKIVTAPFWGIRKHIRVSSIDSGVNTNANGQALDADGKVIEGLYCVGNVGGVFYGGADYPFHQTGLSLGRCYTFGMLAAKHAMGK